MKKIWFEKAWEKLIYWQAKDKKTFNRIIVLLKDIERGSPFEGLGKPEALKGILSGCWSRRIDEKNRLVYRVKGEFLEILQCGSHCNDK